MYKLLYFNLIFSFFYIGIVGLIGQSVSELKHSFKLDDSEIVKERLFHSLSDQETYSSQDLVERIHFNRNLLISKIYLDRPELAYDIQNFDNGLKKDKIVSKLIHNLVKKESVNEVLPNGLTLNEYVGNIGADKAYSSALSFYVGYEAFKNKNLNEALTHFKKAVNSSGVEREYAYYYSGLIYFLNNQFEESRKQLLQVRPTEYLSNHMPYYLSASLFAQKKYKEVIRHYSPRIKEKNLFNHEGLAKVIALSYYHNDDFKSSLEAIAKFDFKDDPLFVELFAIMNNTLGHYNKTIKLTDKVGLTKLSDRAKFEKAIALGVVGDYEESNYIFNELSTTNINQDLLWLNIATNYARQGNIELSLVNANKIKNEIYKKKSQGLINNQIADLSNLELISELVNKQLLTNQTKSELSQTLYNLGINEISTSESDQSLNSISELLRKIAPESIEIVSLDIIRILSELSIAKNRDNINKLELLTRRMKRINPGHALLIDSYYILGYHYYHIKQTSIALGYFNQANEIIQKESSGSHKLIHQDLMARIGDSYLLLENYSQALEIYQLMSSERYANADYALNQEALIHQIKGQNYDQIVVLEDLIRGFPNSIYLSSATDKAAKAYFNLGQFDNSKRHYLSLLKASKDQNIVDNALLQLGLINVNAGDYNQAEEYYKLLLQSSSDEEIKDIAKNSLREIYSDYKINSDALVKLASLDNDVNAEELLFSFAKNKFLDGEYDIAEAELNKHTSAFPESMYSAEISYYLMSIRKSKGEISFQEYKKYLDKYPTSAHFKEVATLLYDELVKNKNFEELIETNNLKWFEEIENSGYHIISAYTSLKRIDQSLKYFKKVESTLTTDQKRELITKVYYQLASEEKWREVLSLSEKDTWNKYIDHNPKTIFFNSLALFNTNKIEDCITSITDNYELLIEDIAWLTKGVILLSDAYFINGDKTMAIASLEGLLDSDIVIPTQLKEEAQKRLNTLNL